MGGRANECKETREHMNTRAKESKEIGEQMGRGDESGGTGEQMGRRADESREV